MRQNGFSFYIKLRIVWWNNKSRLHSFVQISMETRLSYHISPMRISGASCLPTFIAGIGKTTIHISYIKKLINADCTRHSPHLSLLLHVHSILTSIDQNSINSFNTIYSHTDRIVFRLQIGRRNESDRQILLVYNFRA